MQLLAYIYVVCVCVCVCVCVYILRNKLKNYENTIFFY